MTGALDSLQSDLGYRFSDTELLDRALVHRSFLEDHPERSSNETLEFLGDAVLQLAVTDYLLHSHAQLAEGQLTKIRAAVVSEHVLAEVARAIGVGPAVRMGRAEEMTGGREKASILSDAMEALLGGVFLDAGFDEAQRVILAHWTLWLDAKAEEPGSGDFKGRLQELLARDGMAPSYRTTGAGPDHRPVFSAVVSVGDREIGRGDGTSKKRAEQEAARAALEASGAD